MSGRDTLLSPLRIFWTILMKRRKTKKLIGRSAYHVAIKLKEFLLRPEERHDLSNLNCALVSLISAHMQLDCAPRSRLWWVDDLEWTQWSPCDTQLTGIGKIWRGLRSRPAAEIRDTAFVSCLRLNRSGRELSYVLVFKDDGEEFRLSSSDNKTH